MREPGGRISSSALGSDGLPLPGRFDAGGRSAWTTIEEGKNGFLVDVEDHDALADRLVHVLKLSDQRVAEDVRCRICYCLPI